MFHFPALPPQHLYIQCRVTRHHSRRVSPFGHPRITARLTAPRGISQPPTSFIGSQCQGIHHAPLNTYNTKNQKMRKKSHYNKPHHQHSSPKGKNMPAHVRLDARNHYPQIKHHTPPPSEATTKTPNHPRRSQRSRLQSGASTHPQSSHSRGWACGPVVSGPNSVSGGTRKNDPRSPVNVCLSRTHQHSTTENWHVSQPPDPSL